MQLESSVTLFDDNKVESKFAELKVTADGISSEVSRKVGSDEVISRINQSAESVHISASKVDIDGVITAVNDNTTTTIDGDKITTGTISTDQLTVGAKNATLNNRYITDIGSDGIRIHDANTSNNSAVIKSNGLEVFKGGTTSAYSVAFFGETVRIGKSNQQRVEVTSSAVEIRDSGGALATRMNTNGLEIYRAGSLRAATTANGLDIYGSNGSTVIASFGSSITLGSWADDYCIEMSGATDYANISLGQREGAGGRLYWDGSDGLHLSASDYSLTIGGAAVEISSSWGGMTLSSGGGNLHLAANPAFGEVIFNGHSSGIGSILSNTVSKTITTTGIDTYTQGASITVPEGTWVITGSWVFNTGSSSGARNLGVVLSTSSGSANSGILARQRIYANNNAYAELQAVYVGKFSSDTVVYVKGASSMTYTTAAAIEIRAVRIE